MIGLNSRNALKRNARYNRSAAEREYDRGWLSGFVVGALVMAGLLALGMAIAP